MSPSSAVGVGMAQRALRRGGSGLPLGTALLTLLFAVGTVAAAGSFQASLTHLLDSPTEFGVTWDVSVAGLEAGGDTDDALADLRSLSEVEATASIVGTDIEIGDEVLWVHAIEPLSGPPDAITPVVTSGRVPETADEIALGSTVMDDLGVGIGDTVEARSTVTGSDPAPLEVVGTAVVNDSYENSPGRGGFVTKAWMDRYAPEVGADPHLVKLEPGTDVAAFRGRLGDRTRGLVSGPIPQGAIRNVDRISGLPFLLAAVVSALALASFAHALVLSLRRQRRDLAVLKSLGFDRRQSVASVAWFVTTLALPTALLGVPLGVALGRSLWRVVAEQIGVATDPSSSLVWPLAAVAAAVVVANLVGAIPAWRVARARAGTVLRTE